MNWPYHLDAIVPHLHAIHDAINTQGAYWVETDNTSATCSHNPDPSGHIDQRFLRAVIEGQFADDDPTGPYSVADNAATATRTSQFRVEATC
jgi:hypothetical protein